MDRADLPERENERAHYLTHENNVADSRYRKFLSRLAEPLIARLPPHRQGLDYGCGPGPALAAMLEEAGHRMALFDPFFRPDETALARTYDFITCTEAAEHFHRSAQEFSLLNSLLRAGGRLAIMTSFQPHDRTLEDWHYMRDPTHVIFYCEATFKVIASRFGWSCEIPARNVAIMRKPGTSA